MWLIFFKKSKKEKEKLHQESLSVPLLVLNLVEQHEVSSPSVNVESGLCSPKPWHILESQPLERQKQNYVCISDRVVMWSLMIWNYKVSQTFFN